MLNFKIVFFYQSSEIFCSAKKCNTFILMYDEHTVDKLLREIIIENLRNLFLFN